MQQQQETEKGFCFPRKPMSARNKQQECARGLLPREALVTRHECNECVRTGNLTWDCVLRKIELDSRVGCYDLITMMFMLSDS